MKYYSKKGDEQLISSIKRQSAFYQIFSDSQSVNSGSDLDQERKGPFEMGYNAISAGCLTGQRGMKTV